MSNAPGQGMGQGMGESARNVGSKVDENVKQGTQNVSEGTQNMKEGTQQQLGSNPQSDSTKKSHATNPDESAVPKKLQEKLPESVERAVPNVLHPTGPK